MGKFGRLLYSNTLNHWRIYDISVKQESRAIAKMTARCAL